MKFKSTWVRNRIPLQAQVDSTVARNWIAQGPFRRETKGKRNEQYKQTLQLRARFNLRILGGCCGTDASHIAALAAGLTGNDNVSEHPFSR